MKNIFSPSLFDNVPIRLSTIFCSPSHPVKNHEVSFNLHVMHNRNRIIQSRSYLAGETSAKEKYYSKKLFSFQLSKCSVTEWLKQAIKTNLINVVVLSTYQPWIKLSFPGNSHFHPKSLRMKTQTASVNISVRNQLLLEREFLYLGFNSFLSQLKYNQKEIVFL